MCIVFVWVLCVVYVMCVLWCVLYYVCFLVYVLCVVLYVVLCAVCCVVCVWYVYACDQCTLHTIHSPLTLFLTHQAL